MSARPARPARPASATNASAEERVPIDVDPASPDEKPLEEKDDV